MFNRYRRRIDLMRAFPARRSDSDIVSIHQRQQSQRPLASPKVFFLSDTLAYSYAHLTRAKGDTL
jgi:hypothetical protein